MSESNNKYSSSMIKNSNTRYAVIGGDGMLGSELVKFLRKNNKEVLGTSRRDDRNQESVFLDFTKEDSWENILHCTDACIVGGITDYGECKNNPDAKYVNENCISKLALFLSKNSIRVTFISSGTIFGGKKEFPDESATHCPTMDYAKHKSNAEKKILKMTDEAGTSDLIKIIRITKILTADTNPISGWITNWSKGQQVKAFKDFVFAPITLNYTTKYISNILESKEPGCYHISGSQDIDYVRFGKILAQALGYPSSFVAETTSVEAGVKVLFLPKYGGIGMKQTIKTFGTEGQNIHNLVEELLYELSTVDA